MARRSLNRPIRTRSAARESFNFSYTAGEFQIGVMPILAADVEPFR